MKTSRVSVIGILPRETPATLHGFGEDREKGDSEIDRRSVLNNGSRQCAVQIYIFGSQPCVEKDVTREVGGPRDVKTQTQVSKKTSVGRGE